MHDLYHGGKPQKDKWSERPVYVFHIQEIYDNSPMKMGQKNLLKIKKQNSSNLFILVFFFYTLRVQQLL